MSIPTRQSILSRLKAILEDGSWREIFEIYWKLIYNTARKCGLSDSEAQNVVQETMVTLKRDLYKCEFDPQQVSFKAWLQESTERNIGDQIRKRPQWNSTDGPTERDLKADIQADWDNDWSVNIVDEALRRVRTRMPPKEFQAFYTNVVHRKGAKATAELLRMSLPAVYMSTYKVKRALRIEMEKLETGARQLE